MIVQACLNGARPRDFHPRLPATSPEIVADAVEAIRAGAHELHVHVRNEGGAETLDPAAVDAVISGIRSALPGTLVGISTGAWIEKDDRRRLSCIDRWRTMPDYASVNLSETDAPAVFAHVLRRGVAVEAGLATATDAERFVKLGLQKQSLRILIELDDGGKAEQAAHDEASRVLDVLARAEVRKPILIHGAGRNVWSFVERAARERYSTRVGLEDGATMPDGSVAESNAALVAAALAIMSKR